MWVNIILLRFKYTFAWKFCWILIIGNHIWVWLFMCMAKEGIMGWWHSFLDFPRLLVRNFSIPQLLLAILMYDHHVVGYKSCNAPSGWPNTWYILVHGMLVDWFLLVFNVGPSSPSCNCMVSLGP